MSSLPPLKVQLKTLEKLQELDLKIDQVKIKKESLPSELKALDSALFLLTSQLKSKSETQAELEKNVRQASAAIDLNNDRLVRAAKKLEGVQNTTEFSAAQKEIEQLKKMNDQLGEQKTKFSLEIESIKALIEELNTKIATSSAERETKAGQIAGQNKELDQDLATLNTERKGYTSGILTSTLSRYDRIRPARAGVALSPAANGRCNACNMMIPPQLYNQIQKGLEVHTCPSCMRILFIPESL